jgi:hypothetical protein
MDFGQAEIKAFSTAAQEAQGGQVVYDPQVAHDAVAEYNRLIDALQDTKQMAMALTDLAGFGGFESAKQLQRGFERKAREAMIHIDKMIQACYQMQVAFLTTSSRYGDTDDQNAKSIQASIQAMGSRIEQEVQALKEGHA